MFLGSRIKNIFRHAIQCALAESFSGNNNKNKRKKTKQNETRAKGEGEGRGRADGVTILLQECLGWARLERDGTRNYMYTSFGIGFNILPVHRNAIIKLSHTFS